MAVNRRAAARPLARLEKFDLMCPALENHAFQCVYATRHTRTVAETTGIFFGGPH